MATDLEFNIVGNFNTDSLKEMVDLIAKAKSQTELLQMDIATSMKDMDAPAKLLNGQLDRCLATADRIAQRATKATKDLERGGMTDEERETESRSLQNMFNDFATMQSLMTGSGAFSVSLAKSMMAGLPQAIKHEFNVAAPQIVSALRTGMKAGGGIDVWDLNGMTAAAMKNAGVQRAFGNTSATTQQKADFVRSLLINATPIQRTSEYQIARHGQVVVPTDPKHVEDVLPQLYKGSYAQRGYSAPQYTQMQSSQVLRGKASEKLMQLFAGNNVAVQAAERSGLLRRNSAGELEMNNNSRAQLVQFSEELWRQFTKRTGGLTQKEQDYYDALNQTDQPGEVQKRIIRRAGSGNAGKATAAMSLLSDIMLNENNFTNATPGSGVHRMLAYTQEPKRLKELYSVEKLNPFMGGKSSRVAIAESQMTDLLGMKGRDYENSDAIKIVSLNGYDPNSEEHRRMAREYRTAGLTIGGQHYSFHTQHGTGQNLSYRMIRDDLADQARAKFAPMAERLGLAGNDVFKAFMPAGEFGNMTAMAKYLDQLNKMWTDSYEIGTDLNQKKFAIVDMSKQEGDLKKEFANGIGYTGTGIIPHSLQARGALSLKGSLEQLGAATVGEWADITGKRDAQGRVMMRGLNGDMFDASGYNAILDITQIKNKDAYMRLAQEQGNDAANAAFTEVLRALPLRAVSDYSFDADADSLGPQMMTFLSLSPKMQQYQAEALKERLTELQTLEGQRKLIFNNPMSDPVSAKANDLLHGDEYLETSPEAANRVSLYTERLLRRAGSGEFINYGDVADIQNERLLRSADASWAMTQGGLSDEELAKYQTAFKKAHGRDFSAEEIQKYLMLEGGVADFGHIDAAKVAASRSPTGFGQIITRDNYAGVLAPVFKELYGFTPTGFYGNEEDYKILAGADMDADSVKAIADKENKYGLSLVSEISAVEKKYNDMMLPLEQLEVQFKELAGADGKIDMSNVETREKAMDILTEMAIRAPQDMGFFSNAQSRLAGNLDLFENGLQFAAMTAARGNSGYDHATTEQKKPGEIEKDRAMYAALRLGQEYTKIPAHLTDAFNVKQMMNEDGLVYYEGANGEIIDPSQVFQASSGRFVDKRYFDKIDRTNLPSVMSSTAVGAMLVPRTAADYGFVDNSLYNDLAEVLGIRERTGANLVGEALGYGDFGTATQRVMKNHRDVLAQFAGNQRFSISNEEREIIASQYAEAMQEITGEGLALQQKGQLFDAKGNSISLDSWIKKRATSAGLDQVAMALGTYEYNGHTINTGMTYDNIAARYGGDVARGLTNPASARLADSTRGSFGTRFEGYAAYGTLGESGLRYVDSVGRVTQEAAEQEYAEAQEELQEIESQRKSRQKRKGSRKQRRKEDADLEQRYQEAQQRVSEKEQQLSNIEEMNASYLDFKGVLAQAGAKADEFWIGARGYQNKIDGRSVARGYFNQLRWGQYQPQIDALNEAMENNSYYQAHKGEEEIGVQDIKTRLRQGMYNDFANKGILYAKNYADDLTAALSKEVAPDSSQKRALDKFANVQKESASFIDEIDRILNNPNSDLDKQSIDVLSEAKKKIQDNIDRGVALEPQLRDEFIKTNNENSVLAIEDLKAKYNKNYKKSAKYQSILQNRDLDAQQEKFDQQKREGLIGEDEYNQATAALEEMRAQASPAAIEISDAMNRIGEATGKMVQSVAKRLGRQLFRKALQETKQFIKQYDAAMTEIQTITMKTNEEMDSVKENTINRALELHASISDVASVEGALYRQGLSDTEVAERTESIIKFSKVTGIKAEDATKIVTTAMQNNLVSTPQQAMDALTALGDSAATTAAEIGKAMQKSAAAAKVAGVDFASLTAMATTMTSMTQLGGNQVGTALNTIISRMHQVTTTGYAKDINGESTGINDVEKALNSVGIQLRDAESGEWIDTSQVLLQIAQNWGTMSDIQKSNISTSIAGTRAGNMFQSLMEGMSEDNGETFARYLGLAENSEGVLDDKYAIAIESINTKLEETKTIFDAIVADFISSDVVTGALDFFNGLLSGIRQVTNAAPGLVAGLGSIAVVLGAIVGLATGLAGGPFGALLGAVIGGGAMLGITGLVGNMTGSSDTSAYDKQQSIERKDSYISKAETTIDEYQDLIDQTTKLGESYDSLGDKMESAGSTQLESNLRKLLTVFPELKTSIGDVSDYLGEWSTIVTGANEALDGLRNRSEETATVLSHIAAAQNFDDEVQEAIDKAKSTDYLGITPEDIQKVTSKADEIQSDHDYLNYIMGGSYNHAGRNAYLRQLGIEAGESIADYPGLRDYIASGNYTSSRYNEILSQFGINVENPIDSDLYGYFTGQISGSPVYSSSDFNRLVKMMTGIDIDQLLSSGEERLVSTAYALDDEDVESVVAELNNFGERKLYNEFSSLIDYLNGEGDLDRDLGMYKFLREYVDDNSLEGDFENQRQELIQEVENIRARYRGNETQGEEIDTLIDYILNSAGYLDNSEYNRRLLDYGIDLSRYGDAIEEYETIAPKLNVEQLQKEFLSKYREGQPEINSILSQYDEIYDSFISDAVDKYTALHPGATDEVLYTESGLEYMLSHPDSRSTNQDKTILSLMKYMYNSGLMPNAAEYGFTSEIAMANDFANGFTGLRSMPNGDEMFTAFVEQMYDTLYGNNDVLDQYYGAQSDLMNQAMKEQLDNYMTKYVPSAGFVTDDADLYSKAVLAYVKKLAKEAGYVDEDGNLVYSEDWINAATLGAYFDEAGQVHRAYQDTEAFARHYLDTEEMPYQYNGVGYASLESARQAVEAVVAGAEEGVDTRILKNEELQKITANGKSVYDNAGNIVSDAMQYYLQNNKDYKTDLRTLIDYSNEVDNIEGFQKLVPSDNLNAVLNANPSLLKLWNAVKEGSEYFTYSDLQTSLLNAYTGQSLYTNDQYQSLLNNVFGANGQTMAQRLEAGTFGTTSDTAAYLDMLQDPAAASMIPELTSKYEGLSDILDKVANGTALTAEEQKNLAGVMASSGVKAAQKYGSATEAVAKTLEAAKKGGKDAAGALASATAQFNKTQDNLTAVGKARGKAGSKIDSTTRGMIASFFDISDSDVKEMTQEQLEPLLDAMETSVNDEFSNYLTGIWDQIAEMASGENPVVDLSGVSVDVNGQMDMSQLTAACEGTAAEILANIMALAGNYGSVTFEVDEAGNVVSVNGVANASRSGGYHGGGGGGGGGGKSDLDKMLERHKHGISEIEHLIKMNEIDETKFDRMNQYDDYFASLDKEIGLQERLAAQYRTNIAELNDMIKTLDAGSDDYNKAMESLWGYQEALASISNTIDEVNAKRINALSEKQENADKPGTHKRTMLDTLASRYLNAKEYENYYSAMEETIRATRDEITQNNGQIAEWESLLTTYKENSDEWIEVRDNIWALREENASLENDALQNIIDLNNQKIAQIAEELQHNQAFDNHAINMLNTYGQMYNSNRQYDDYRKTLSDANGNQSGLITQYEDAIADLLELMNALDETSDAWYSARDSVFEYEEAIASARASIQENEMAIEQSVASELTENYDRMTSEQDHVMKMLQNQKQIYEDAGDWQAAVEMMRKEKSANLDNRAAMEASLKVMEEQISTLTEDSDAYDTLKDKILSAREAISSLNVELAKADDTIEQFKIDNMIKAFDRMDNLSTHNIKMYQGEETMYQTLGQLTNYGTILAAENDIQKEYADNLKSHIKDLKEEFDNVEEGSENYYKLQEAIYKYEEQLKSTNNTIDKNNKLLEQNEIKIRQTTTAVENTIDKEIRARIQKTREMLAGEVSMQNTILDTIKKRYTDEWNLVKQDIATKKDALNQEKSLINERLNARKQATDQADRYEELAEYKRQLALLSADPTRTKEAKELRKKIADLEKDIAYDVAQAEANAETERINDNIQAYDDYIKNAEEDLNMLLADSDALMADAMSRFGWNVTELMEGGWENLLEWLKANSAAFRNASDEMQEQMIQSWEDTWKKMKGITDTYWVEVAVLMADKGTFLDYLKASDTYLNSSKEQQAIYDQQWEELYDNYINAHIDDAEYSHDHDLAELTTKIDEAKDWTYEIGLSGETKKFIEDLLLIDYSNGIAHKPVDTSDIRWDDNYAGIGYVEPPAPAATEDASAPAAAPTGNGNKGSTGKSYTVYYATDSGVVRSVTGTSEEDAWAKVPGNAKWASESRSQVEAGVSSVSDTKKKEDFVSSNDGLKKYFEDSTKNANGGLVDYTGYAWVDGSPTRPEAFLSAADTENIRAMMDMLNYVNISSARMPSFQGMYGDNYQNFGDINVTINEAQLKEDDDYEYVAKRVGKAFSKELSRQGFNLAQVSF